MAFKTAFGQILNQPRGKDGSFQAVNEVKPIHTVFGSVQPCDECGENPCECDEYECGEEG